MFPSQGPGDSRGLEGVLGGMSRQAQRGSKGLPL